MQMKKTEKYQYKPTPFMLPTSHYDKNRADRAVLFIQSLKHTKGVWAGKPFYLFPWQEQIIRDLFGVIKENGYRQFNTAYIEIGKKNGKQLALSTCLPTPDGYTTMGAVRVGDALFDERGQICHVVAKSEVDYDEQAYRITFRDGAVVVAGERHLWPGETTYGKRRQRLLTTGEVYRLRRKTSKRESIPFRIAVAQPVRTKEAKLPVHPYLTGYWLGNGKRIPPSYLRASISQRFQLLQGLMDSDGAISDRKGQAIYCTTEKALAGDVSELLWSLGIKNAITTAASTQRADWSKPGRECGRIATGETVYYVKFTAFDDRPIAGLARKQERAIRRRPQTRSHFRYIAKIEPIGNPGMQCIQVDSPSHQYLVGRSFLPTHNSELAAAVALYMLCADNEEGAEIYGCANDRAQASIVFDVAKDMVLQSELLMKRIKIIESQKRLVYMPTRSIYQALSSDVASKYGYNVHGCIFDELLGQPNRKLFDVMTKGSGAARKQPLNFIITTAGNDRTSICYEQHAKAADILAGRKHDSTFYPVLYSAPDDADWTDPAVWAMANPSIGRTVDFEYYQQRCESAKENPAEEIQFRQFHLCQWTNTAVRWMPMNKWDACCEEYTMDSLIGRACYGGLDLSSTSDLTAFVLVFPPTERDPVYRTLSFFWLPEDTIPLRVRRDHVPYDVWQRQNIILTTEGDVVHYGFIEQYIVNLGRMFNIREIAVDRWNASMMVQALQDDGFTMVPFGQGFKDMSNPTKDLMRLVLEQSLRHDGHPILRWCMDNVYVRTDPAGNIKPDKEKSTEKIDGVVALVMALDRAQRHLNGGSVYDERGLLTLDW